jgi:hypothetical protein
VPNTVCKNCHVTGDTALWQRIAATAGHRVHLQSDSSSLKNIKCVDCHGNELHQFQSVKTTCGQSGCHNPKETGVVLGKMASQTMEHCTSCHEFTLDVPALATLDSARGTLVPGESQCLGCHKMKKVLADFDARKDPHGGKCGTCHNPHVQKTPAAAANTCATAGCHANWRDEPFHVGASHKRVASRCLTCHIPHSAKVDASNCQGCHESVRARGKSQPPLPFDTARALRRAEMTPERKIRVAHSLPTSNPVRLALASFDRTSPPSRDEALRSAFDPRLSQVVHLALRPPPPSHAAPEKFPHARHEKLACSCVIRRALEEGVSRSRLRGAAQSAIIRRRHARDARRVTGQRSTRHLRQCRRSSLSRDTAPAASSRVPPLNARWKVLPRVSYHAGLPRTFACKGGLQGLPRGSSCGWTELHYMSRHSATRRSPSDARDRASALRRVPYCNDGRPAHTDPQLLQHLSRDQGEKPFRREGVYCLSLPR